MGKRFLKVIPSSLFFCLIMACAILIDRSNKLKDEIWRLGVEKARLESAVSKAQWDQSQCEAKIQRMAPLHMDGDDNRRLLNKRILEMAAESARQ